MRELAIEGVDGVGKTTAIAELVLALEEEGQSVQVSAPYREVARSYPGVDVYAAMQEPSLAQDVLGVLALEIGRATEAARDAHADVLLFDRHWMTSLVEFRREGAGAPGAIWLAGKPQTALLHPDLRLAPELYDRLIFPDEPWADCKERVEEYVEQYHRLASGYSTAMLGVYRVDRLTTPQKIARAIRWDIRILR